MSDATVLLVDDDVMVLRAMARAFSALGVEVVTLDKSFGLLNRIAELRPAVVVLDVRMPGLDGASLVHLIRDDPSIAGTRVLLHSGMASHVLAATADACGADGWAAKEQGMTSLVAAVRRLLPLGALGHRATAPLGSPLPVEVETRLGPSTVRRSEMPGKTTIRGMPAVRFFRASRAGSEES